MRVTNERAAELHRWNKLAKDMPAQSAKVLHGIAFNSLQDLLLDRQELVEVLSRCVDALETSAGWHGVDGQTQSVLDQARSLMRPSPSNG